MCVTINGEFISKTSIKPTSAAGTTGTLIFKKKRKRNTLIQQMGLYTGGLISGWAYIQNNIFVGKWMGLYPGGLKTAGGFKVWILRYNNVERSGAYILPLLNVRLAVH